jgi:Fe-S cluster biogenesis protein NfuA
MEATRTPTPSAPPTPSELETSPEVNELRQRIRSHGGDIRIEAVDDDGTVDVEFVGACRGCPAIAFTYSVAVHPTLSTVPGVRAVRSRQVRFSRIIADRVGPLAAEREHLAPLETSGEAPA